MFYADYVDLCTRRGRQGVWTGGTQLDDNPITYVYITRVLENLISPNI